MDADRHVAGARGAGAHRLDGDAGANGGARETSGRGRSAAAADGTAAAATRRDARASRDDAVDASALVTGWSSGLGRATAMRLVREGYALVVPYRLGGFDAAAAFASACRRAGELSRGIGRTVVFRAPEGHRCVFIARVASTRDGRARDRALRGGVFDARRVESNGDGEFSSLRA